MEDRNQNPFYKPIKLATTVRVNLGVFLWFKGTGKDYQTRMNAIPRDAMLRSVHQKT